MIIQVLRTQHILATFSNFTLHFQIQGPRQEDPTRFGWRVQAEQVIKGGGGTEQERGEFGKGVRNVGGVGCEVG